MVIVLCMCVAGWSTINNLQTWIRRFDWPAFISKVECNHLEVFKVHDIRDKASQKTVTMVANIINAKKRVWLETGDGRRRREPYWAVVKKRLVAETAPKNRDIIRKNTLLFLSYGLLYLDLADACRKSYSGYVEKCISYLVVIYQSSNNTKYAIEITYMVACFKKL